MDDLTSPPERGSAARQGHAQAPPQVKANHRMRVAIGLLIVAALVVGGTLYWLWARQFASTDDAFIDANTTQIAPRVAGQVTRLLFADNQHVTAGQVLVRIDPADYQARLDLALAQQASAAATLQEAEAQVRVRQAAVDQAAADARVAQADLTRARQDFDRYKALPRGAASRQQIDDAAAAYQSAVARLEARRQTVGGAKAQVSAADAQVLAAQAGLRQSEASVRTARLQLSYCQIVAPVSGVVTHRSVSVGNYVEPGQPLFALVQDGRWVTANFKETQLAGLHPGQAVKLEIDAVPNVTFRGKVDSFQAGTGSAFSVLPAENATGNYVKIVQRLPVKIDFDDPRINQYRLEPGMSVVPTIRVR